MTDSKLIVVIISLLTIFITLGLYVFFTNKKITQLKNQLDRKDSHL